jgi:hypothetical protein
VHVPEATMVMVVVIMVIVVHMIVLMGHLDRFPSWQAPATLSSR